MKKLFAFLLLSFVGVATCACSNGGANNQTNIQKLDVPSNIQYDSNTHQLTWGYVDNAIGYEVMINSKTNETYDLLYIVEFDTEQDFYYKVRAIGDGKNYLSSEYSTPTKARFVFSDTKEFPNLKYTVKNPYELNSGYANQKSFKDNMGNSYRMFFLGRIYDVPLIDTGDNRLSYLGQNGEQNWSVQRADLESIKNQVSLAISKTVNVKNVGNNINKNEVPFEEKKIEPHTSNLSYEWSKTWGGIYTSYLATFQQAVNVSNAQSESVTISFNETYPQGYYRYILMGDLDVFVNVVAETDGRCYYEVISSIVSSQYKWDYSPTSPLFNDYIPGSLGFDISIIDSMSEPSETTDLISQNGSKDKPYYIGNKVDFQKIKNLVGDDVYFKQTRDISFDGDTCYVPSFFGHYDGCGYALNNLSYDLTSVETVIEVGLFGVNHGTIENISIKDFNIIIAPDWLDMSRTINAGVLVGTNATSGTIKNCSIENTSFRVDSSDIAMIFERRNGVDPRIIDKTYSCWVEWLTQSYDHHVNGEGVWDNICYTMNVGGIVGVNEGVVDSCHFDGKIESNLFNMDINDSVRQYQYTGGLIGLNNGVLKDSTAKADIKVWLELDNNGNGLGWVANNNPKANSYAGCIAGVNAGVIEETSNLPETELPSISFRAYAPPYALLAGADYSGASHSNTGGIIIKTDMIAVSQD